MTTPSQKQIEANRRNALKSTGPKTEQGKARSRRNGLKHGLAAEVLIPEEDSAAYDAALARWTREAGPDNVVEHHLIRRAAAGSVTLERIERAKQDTRQETAREAVAVWERRQQARARRKAQDLANDPFNTVEDLETTAFGCDWMIRQWQALQAPLSLGRAWDQRMLAKAQLLLGLPEGTPALDADRLVRKLWILAGAAQPDKVAALPRLAAEAGLPTDPTLARTGLRQFILEQIDRLQQLREDSWEAIEGPECRAVATRAAAADTSKEGQLRHRYEVSADRATNAAIRQFLNLRDRRRREHIEMAKEAKGCNLLRAPVGGGWWREPDSDPAPPGFERIADQPNPAPAEASPIAEPAPSDPGAPERSEAISPPRSAATSTRNPNRHQELRDSAPDRRPEPFERTDPNFTAPTARSRCPEAG
jgi:hypothetical protein